MAVTLTVAADLLEKDRQGLSQDISRKKRE